MRLPTKRDVDNLQQFLKAAWEASQGWLWLVLMWVFVASNFTHIESILARWANRSDWTTWALAVGIEIISGLSFSNALTHLGTMLASTGKNATKERKRRARVYFGLSMTSGLAAAIFSGYINVLWYNQVVLAGIAAPIGTVVCAMMEASRRYEIRVVAAKRQEKAEEDRKVERRRKEEERRRREATCQICHNEVGEAALVDGKCFGCRRAAEGKTHALPLELSLSVLERDEWICYYCGENLRDVPAGKRHIDHFIPRSKGGEDIVENLVTSCQNCNLTKNDRLPNEREQWRFSQYLRAKAAGTDRRSQILALAHTNGDGTPLKQKEIAKILHTSPGWVSTVINEAKQTGKNSGDSD